MVKPDIYIDLGDNGEWSYFSTHYWRGRFAKPMEDLIPLLETDIKEVNAGMDWIDESLDKAGVKERHFVQGNHEVWLDRFVERYPYLDRLTTIGVKLEGAIEVLEQLVEESKQKKEDKKSD